MRLSCHSTPTHPCDNNSTNYAHSLNEQQTHPDLTTHKRRRIRRQTVVMQYNDAVLHDTAQIQQYLMI